jgi:hypothetical protein
MFERRSFALRNARRANLLLGLARLHLNNVYDVNRYHEALRDAAANREGRARVHQRSNRDSDDQHGNPQPSLR